RVGSLRLHDALVAHVMTVEAPSFRCREDEVIRPGAALRKLFLSIHPQRLLDDAQERHGSDSRACLRPLQGSVATELVADVDFPLLEIDVLPAECKCLRDTQSCPGERGNDRLIT